MTKSSLPPRVTLLGEALGPVWRNLSDRIDAPVTPSGETFERREHLYRNVKVTGCIGDRLQRRFDELLDASARNENATDSDLYRAIGKLEAVLDDFGSRGELASRQGSIRRAYRQTGRLAARARVRTARAVAPRRP